MGLRSCGTPQLAENCSLLRGHKLAVVDVAWSPDGTRLATGTSVWDTRSGKELLTLKGQDWPVTSVA